MQGSRLCITSGVEATDRMPAMQVSSEYAVVRSRDGTTCVPAPRC